MKAVPITRLMNGQSGRVSQIQGGRGVRAKLEALGIFPGAVVGKKSAVGGAGPVIITVGLGEVAIGYNIASRLWVEVAER
ncbi:MAG: FeoA family protein [bacterium]|jgi:ferrous iron transport protein A